MRALLALLPLLAGCAVAPATRQTNPPPLPVPPPGPPVESPGPAPRELFAQWHVDERYRDTLETTENFSEWADLEGPYDEIDLDGVRWYNVPVSSDRAKMFLRIRRVHGPPWLNTPKIETETD